MGSTGGYTSTGGAASYGFFVMGDPQVTGSTNSLQIAIGQMKLIDNKPIAAFTLGDLTDDATSAEWTYHNQFVSSFFDVSGYSLGTTPRYFAAVGNHDVLTSNWLTLWNTSLPGQQGLGHNGSDGIYYSIEYQGALFAVLDTEHVSGVGTAYSDAQSQKLAASLKASSAPFKFLLFHEPVYPCNSIHQPFAAGLPWVDLAERNNVAIVFAGHTHVYSRTCPMKNGTCTSDGSGIVQVESGPVGTPPRAVNVTSRTFTGTDSAGAARTDTYNCTTNLRASGSANDFCYVKIAGCTASFSCYVVGAGNTTPFDSWTINRCPAIGASANLNARR